MGLSKLSIIVSIIVSVLYMIYTIVEYYGYTRKISLKLFPIESYIDKYKNLPAASNDRVVVLFDGNKSVEEKQLGMYLKSMLDQTVRVNEVGVVIPYAKMGNIPVKYKKYLDVCGYSKDYGDAALVVCSVLKEPESNTRIILTDASQIYPQDFIENVIKKSDDNSNAIIKGENYILFRPSFFTDKISHTKSCDINTCLKEYCDASTVNATF